MIYKGEEMKIKDLGFGHIIVTHPNSQTPHTCPVCMGKGIVPSGFYSYPNNQWTTTSATPEKCKSCNGSGVIWS